VDGHSTGAVVDAGAMLDNSAMKEVRRSALVGHSPAQIFALIADVEAYPSFLPWCTAARIDERSAGQVVATLGLKRGPLHAEFTTRNTLEADRSIAMTLVRGPFRTLEGIWTLAPVGDAGCKVDLSLRFEFANRLTAAVLTPIFEETAASLVDAFVARARSVHRR
jgi:ribosome-associated toxin RatA of RatAB toxin-antitoxin module